MIRELKVGESTYVISSKYLSVTDPKSLKSPKAFNITAVTGAKALSVAKIGKGAKGRIRDLKGGEYTSVKSSKSTSVTSKKAPKSDKTIKGTGATDTKAPSVANSGNSTKISILGIKGGMSTAVKGTKSP